MALKPGRNHPCPCGSGKKQWNCCGANQSTPFNEAELYKSVQPVDPRIKYSPVPEEEQRSLRTQLVRFFSDDCLPITPAWPSSRKAELRRRTVSFIGQRVTLPVLHIMPNEMYSKAVEPFPAAGNALYWNEIDKRVHFFRGHILEAIRDRFLAVLRAGDDYVTGACCLRQALELACHAACCQWILTTAYNQLAKGLPSTKSRTWIQSKELEDFAITLAAWPRKALLSVGELLGKDAGQVCEAAYSKAMCNPTTDKVLGVAHTLAKFYDEGKGVGVTNCAVAVKMLDLRHKFLCGFVHATPMVYRNAPPAPLSLEDAQVAYRSVCGDVFGGVLDVLEGLFLRPELDGVLFQNVTQPFRLKPGEKIDCRIECTFGWVKDFMNRYKAEVSIITSGGKVTLFERK